MASSRRQMEVSPCNVLIGEPASGKPESETSTYRSESDVDCADEELLGDESGEQDVADPSEPRTGNVDHLGVEHVTAEQQFTVMQGKLTLHAEIQRVDGVRWAELDERVLERRHCSPIDKSVHPTSGPHHKPMHDGLGVVEVNREIPQPTEPRSILAMYRLTDFLAETKHARF